MSEMIVKGKDTPVTALTKLMEANKGQIVKALPKHLSADRLIRMAVTALNVTPSLQNCSMLSICNSVMLAAQLGLEPNNGLGHGWLIPYKGTCTFQPGYRGLIELAYRSGRVNDVTAVLVYENEPFKYIEGSEPLIQHEPLPPSKRGANLIGCYSRIELDDKTRKVHFMWIEDIHKVRDKASQTKNSGPWVTWYEEMVKKTVLKRHMKTQQLSSEVNRAIGIDDQAEGFAAQAEEEKRAKQVAQDLVLEATFVEEADAATFALSGSREDQHRVRDEKLAEMEKAHA